MLAWLKRARKQEQRPIVVTINDAPVDEKQRVAREVLFLLRRMESGKHSGRIR